MRLLLLLLTVALLGLGWRSNAAGSIQSWWQQRFGGAPSASEIGESLETQLLATRQRWHAGPLLPDARLQNWLAERMERDIADMDQFLQEVQTAFPEYQGVAAMQAWRANGEELAARLGEWADLGGRDFTHMAVAARPALWGLGWQACVVVGHRLPNFSPEALSEGKAPLYYSECSLCGGQQACQIPRHTRSLSLECSRCRRTYAMVASGSDGRFRYVNEFLTGYAPPARYGREQPRLAELMAIWRAVSTGCRYTQDTGTDDNDAWQTARETQILGKGDCEDSAILLADWLITRGFETRVALGRYAERGGHAWVVVRLEGQDYLLESTEGASAAAHPPLLAEVGSRYVPEILFDREAFYTRVQPLGAWSGDFWSDKSWLRIVPRSQRPPQGGIASQ